MMKILLAFGVALLMVATRSNGHWVGHTFCDACSYKDVCMNSLGPLAVKGMASKVSPKELIVTSLNYTIKHVSASFHFSRRLAANSTGTHKMWMEDCQTLLGFSIDELQSSYTVVGATQVQSLQQKQAQLLNWLSAVRSYQDTCLDAISDTTLRKRILVSGGLTHSSQLTSNVLAVVSTMATIFTAFKVPNFKPFHPQQYSHFPHVGFGETKTKALSPPPPVPKPTPYVNTPSPTKLSSPPPPPVSKPITYNNSPSSTKLSTPPPPVSSPPPPASSSSPPAGNDYGGGYGYSYPSWMPSTDRKLIESSNLNMTPNAIVAKDGSEQFQTIADALAAYPETLEEGARYVIYVKAGVYDEYLTVTKKQVNVLMYGDGPRKTIITGRKNFHEGVSTFRTATFSAIGDGFVAKSIGFQNTAGPEGHQAVALRVQSDMSAFFNCRMDGYQDTLYVQTHRQFYRNCVVSGTVDFIFGDAAAVLQNCLIIVRKPGPGQKNAVTAQGRVDKYETTGLVIQNSRIVPEQKLEAERLTVPTYLGRPWKEYSRTVIMETTIGDLIQPAGWLEWDGPFALETLYYAEYNNRGPGAATDQRVQWKGYKVITDQAEAEQFTPGPFLGADVWLANTGTPHFLGLKKVK